MEKTDIMLAVLTRQRDDALNALVNVIADLEMLKAELAKSKADFGQENKQRE